MVDRRLKFTEASRVRNGVGDVTITWTITFSTTFNPKVEVITDLGLIRKLLEKRQK